VFAISPWEDFALHTMDNVVSQIQDAFEGPIVNHSFPTSQTFLTKCQDFEGQRIAEIICTMLLSVTAVSYSATIHALVADI
jgi:hypothetical protein